MTLFYENKSRVYVYFEDFYYTSITEQPKISGESLVGNIGGLLGLFLGASLLTSVEFLDIAFSLLHLVYSRSKISNIKS